jgi:hypothetical protein
VFISSWLEMNQTQMRSPTNQIIRLVLGALLAPLVPAVVFTAIGFVTLNPWLGVMFGIPSLIVSYPYTLTIGLFAHSILVGCRWTKLLHYLAGGVVASSPIPLLFFVDYLMPVTNSSSLGGMIFAIAILLSGAGVAVGFWFIVIFRNPAYFPQQNEKASGQGV